MSIGCCIAFTFIAYTRSSTTAHLRTVTACTVYIGSENGIILICVPDPTYVHPPPPTVDAGHWQTGPLLGTVVVIVTVGNKGLPVARADAS